MIELTPLNISSVAAGTVAAAFIAGGTVKGTLGVGLPLVTVPILALAIPVPLAVSLTAVPVLASNIWQAYDSRMSIAAGRRFASLSVALLVTTLITVPLTLALPARALSAMVAGTVTLAVVLMSFRPMMTISKQHEKISSPIVGALSGILGGVSALMGPLIISYLMALKLKREEFIGGISLIYLAGAIPLYASLAAYGRLGLAELAWSSAAMIPVAIGLAMGKVLRGRLSEVWFRRMLLIFLSAVAVVLLLR